MTFVNCPFSISQFQGVVRYSQSESAHPSFVIIQAVYDTYDTMPIKSDATNLDDLNSQPDGRFVFIGQYSVQRLLGFGLEFCCR